MALAHSDKRRLLDIQSDEDDHDELLTLDDLRASIGKGSAADSAEGVFHASTEDFIAAMRARRREAAQ